MLGSFVDCVLLLWCVVIVSFCTAFGALVAPFLILLDRKATRSLAKTLARLALVSKVANKMAAKRFLAMIYKLNS